MNITKFYYLRIVLIGVGVNVAWMTSLAAEAGANRFGVDLNVARARSLVAGRCDECQKHLCGKDHRSDRKSTDAGSGNIVATQDIGTNESKITGKDLLVALIGFSAAIIGGLIQSLFALRRATMTAKENARIAYRDKVSDLADRIGGAMHQLLASCDCCLKKWEKHGIVPYSQPDQESVFQESIRKKLDDARDSASELGALRLQARYKLYGMDEALRTLTRVNNWITHFKTNVSAGWKLLEKADALRIVIDEVLMAVIDSGDRPTKDMLQRVACATNALRNQYKATDPRCEENDCDAFGRTDI